jgi:hypothetical protein
MEAITISLSRNHSEQDWSVEIDGSLHDHISTRTLDDLVEYALLVAQQSLLESETSTGSGDSDSIPAPPD